MMVFTKQWWLRIPRVLHILHTQILLTSRTVKYSYLWIFTVPMDWIADEKSSFKSLSIPSTMILQTKVLRPDLSEFSSPVRTRRYTALQGPMTRVCTHKVAEITHKPFI